MSFLRRISTRSLVALVAAVAVLAVGGAAIAVAAGGGGPTPPPKPLDKAIHDALSAAPSDGITAHVKFTNKLFPSGAILGQAGSALMSGADGRLWATNDGRGRIELQSNAGDVQVVWNQKQVSIYDASSNTVYRADLPAKSGSESSDSGSPALAEIDKFLTALGDHWAVSDAQPTNVGHQPAYGVTVSPKHDGGLLGSLDLAWDAAHGAPLRLAVTAQGSSAPVLELQVTKIAYGAVPDANVDVAPPSGANVVDLGGAGSSIDKSSSEPAVTGIDAVQSAAGFPVVAPDSLVGLPRKDVRLVGGQTAIALYGEGLGGLVLTERKADAGANGSNSALSSLPTVSLDGLTAHELATPLGTVLEWQTGGTAYVLAGSLPPAAAESAARAVQ